MTLWTIFSSKRGYIGCMKSQLVKKEATLETSSIRLAFYTNNKLVATLWEEEGETLTAS